MVFGPYLYSFSSFYSSLILSQNPTISPTLTRSLTFTIILLFPNLTLTLTLTLTRANFTLTFYLIPTHIHASTIQLIIVKKNKFIIAMKTKSC